jgi:hypothetical protein
MFFMTINLPFKITVCGIGELSWQRDANVSHVVSPLEP